MSPTTQGGHEAARMLASTRRFMWLLAAPLLALLALLMVTQYRQQHDAVVQSLERRGEAHARELSELVQPAVNHVRDLRRLMEQLWARPPDHGPGLRQALQARQHEGRPDGWTLDGADAATRERLGQLLWYQPDGSAPDAQLLRLAQSFVAQARVVHARSPGFVASWLLPADAAMSVAYPWFPSATAISSMGETALYGLAPYRRSGSQERREWALKHPDIASFWTPPYVDDASALLTVSHLAPVMVDGEFRGEILLDFRLSALQALVERWSGEQAQARFWIVDGQGRILADSAQALSKNERKPGGSGIRVMLVSRLPGGLDQAALDRAAARPGRLGGALDADGHWALLLSPAPGTPWQLVQAVPLAALQEAVYPALLPYLALALALLLMFVAAQWLLARRFVSPAREVLLYLRRIAGDVNTDAPQLSPTWMPWVQSIRATFEARLRAEQQLAQQREALRQSEKLGTMGSLLASVAHELNNPLAIVLGRASLLEEKLQGQATHADAQRIREAAERCGRIVRTFLNMARSRPETRQAVPLNDLVRAAVELLAYSLRADGVTVALRLDPDLPDVPADPDRLGQLVMNLIVNAQQALGMRPGDRRLQISSGIDGGGKGLWLRVADNGPGVAEALRESIFTPFFTTKREDVGTGLGLAVSRGVAREHGGDLVLETERPLGGASFLLTLPLSGGGSTAAAQAPVPIPDAGRQRRVLVVDDEPDLAELMRDALELAGFEVAIAESGAVALRMLEELRVDAIVSDLRMPDVDGAALWRRVRAQWPELATRMLFVTGDTLGPGAAEFLREAGCAALEKPFAPADLVTRVLDLTGA
ncbi:response regulator [Roseateles toxinivorans]|uniref:histidine kinase n=1 Tax=Roseateles toxinivorans TaxID=270368 RepID=A0A4R6QCL2_9BURK|nr:response regulator [Roseateles toxinivorans]TDP59696.1 C4-dicarboxylate-specific signal transduction histidine kinase [Roseateles toxinivorans]